MKRVIHWFRRDLRITDNSALGAACSTGAEIVPVYILSKWTSPHRWTGANRQHFLCGCLNSLANNLESVGGRLIIRQGDPVEVLAALVKESGAKAIFFHRDPDPHGRTVEARLATWAATKGVLLKDFKDVCVHERRDVLTATGQPFRVFTPYAKAWRMVQRPEIGPRAKNLRTPHGLASLPLPTVATWNLSPPSANVLEAGEKAARRRLSRFLDHGLSTYTIHRNDLARGSTSRLSQDLRFGLLSIREVFQQVEDCANSLPAAGRDSAAKFAAELIWREFYMQILWHFPHVLETAFSPKFAGLKWPGNPKDFERWTAGETGFPVVDAAMRELRGTGFMHNRARMITAMFLTKDLHLDWRMGEAYFLHLLTDGEIASNNGGWQWSAGTGADAAPYFRIQNPWTQTRRFDPDGAYIKKWIPELRDVAPEKFFAPPASGRLAPHYPPPMLDHAAARNSTLDIFARHSAGQQPAAEAVAR